jgi:tetratricopeptide (TPR) repeat protein
MKSFSRYFFSIVALCVALFFACSESKETRVQRFLMQGNDMVEKNNDEEAIKFFEGAIALDSCFVDAWNNLGTVNYKRKNYEMAIEQYSRAIRCNPNYTQSIMNRANTYYESGEFYSALKDLEKVEKISEDTLPLHFLRGLVFTKLKRYNEAKLSFIRGLKIEPQNTELKVNMGSVYYFMGSYDSARLWLKDIVAMGANEPNAFNTLSLVEAETGNYGEALALIKKALDLKPSDAFYLNNRGYIYLMQNENEKALADINESITLDPYNAWAYRNKAIYFFKKSNYDEALRLLQYANKLDKTIANLNFYLGEVYWAKGDKANACLYYRKSEELKDPLRRSVLKNCPTG